MAIFSADIPLVATSFLPIAFRARITPAAKPARHPPQASSPTSHAFAVILIPNPSAEYQARKLSTKRTTPATSAILAPVDNREKSMDFAPRSRVAGGPRDP